MVALTVGWVAITIFRDTIWFVQRQAGLILDEIDADRFAYMTLSRNPRELLEVANFFGHWPPPADPTIPADLQEMDAVRRDILAKNLAEARKRRGKVRGYVGLPQPSRTEMQVWLCFVIVAALVPLSS